MTAPVWWVTRDGDVDVRALYNRHYSHREYRDGRQPQLFTGPGEKLVLRTRAGDAAFVWRVFLDDCIDARTGTRQGGVNCAIFRNESPHQSSELITQADRIAACVWPGRRHYTYVDPTRVASGLPGNCFVAAGWRYARARGHRLRTIDRGLLILETGGTR